jgi:hypothetical protein
MSENNLEKPVPDAEEQRRAMTDEPDVAPEETPSSLPFDANEADAVEQHQEVELDEDDYR